MYQIYTRELCNYCDMAKAELNRLELPFEEISQTHKSKEELLARSGLNEMRLTYPQIFAPDGKLIGGFEDLLDYTESFSEVKY